MANKVEICGVDTARLPLYKEAEMTEMLEKIKEMCIRDRDVGEAVYLLSRKVGSCSHELFVLRILSQAVGCLLYTSRCV